MITRLMITMVNDCGLMIAQFMIVELMISRLPIDGESLNIGVFEHRERL